MFIDVVGDVFYEVEHLSVHLYFARERNINGEHTMPIVRGTLPIFFENGKHPAAIFVKYVAIL